jgi:hypothetical protein
MLSFRKKKRNDLETVLLAQDDRLKQLAASAGPSESRGQECNSICDVEPDIDAPTLITIPTWEQMVSNANDVVPETRTIDDILSREDLEDIDTQLAELNEEFAAKYRLDKYDIAFAVMSGILAAAVDMFLVGVPQRTSEEGLRGGKLENYVRDKFKEWLPEEEMKKLAASAEAKVPYDAPYNMGFTEEWVEGLNPYMHRLYSLGHDPLLGFVIGVGDILSGSITTIDKMGNVVVQQIGRYSDRKASTVVEALIRQFVHLKTDVNTSMGLPAPLMGLFNLLQFGEIGEEKLTIAEIVQGMYYEGYDFEHFCAQSIPVMLAELSVRLCYLGKRLHEGYPLRESIPFSTNRDKHPKLATMLFLAHSVAAGIDAGRVYFSKNPMELSYPEMVVFAGYAIKQLKWAAVDKPALRHKNIMKALDEELEELSNASDERLKAMEGFEFYFA